MVGGGRVSDKHIVEHSGYLNNLLPGDVILADRGFDVADSVAMLGATLDILAFTRAVNNYHLQISKPQGSWQMYGFMWKELSEPCANAIEFSLQLEFYRRNWFHRRPVEE